MVRETKITVAHATRDSFYQSYQKQLLRKLHPLFTTGAREVCVQKRLFQNDLIIPRHES